MGSQSELISIDRDLNDRDLKRRVWELLGESEEPLLQFLQQLYDRMGQDRIIGETTAITGVAVVIKDSFRKIDSLLIWCEQNTPEGINTQKIILSKQSGRLTANIYGETNERCGDSTKWQGLFVEPQYDIVNMSYWPYRWDQIILTCSDSGDAKLTALPLYPPYFHQNVAAALTATDNTGGDHKMVLDSILKMSTKEITEKIRIFTHHITEVKHFLGINEPVSPGY